MQVKNNKTQPKKQTKKKSLEQKFKEACNEKKLGMIQSVINMFLEKNLNDIEALAVIKKMLDSIEYSDIKGKPQPQAIKKGGKKCN